MNRSDAAAAAVVAILDDVLWLVGVPGELAKADRSALTRSGFRLLVNALVVAMRHETREPQHRAIRGAVARIEREWPRLATGDRERALAGALGQLRVGMVEAALGVGETMAASVRGTIAATRQAAAARHRLTVPEVFSLRDQQAVDHARRSAELFVRTRFGAMVDGPLATVVRGTVAKGIEDGVDPQQIGRDLETALRGTVAARTQGYFAMVASTATARARTWGILNSFREASIPRYQVQSVRDEHTCPVCYFMHGQTFDVGASLDAFAAAAAAPPQDIGNHQPFMGVGRIGGVLHVGARTSQGFVPVATYLPGAGPASEGGRLFQQLEPADRIQRLGCGCPFHPHCRCLLLPVFGRVQVPATAPVGPAAMPAAPVAPPPAVTRPPTPAAPPPPPAPAPVPAVPTPAPPPVPTPRSPAPATPTTPAAPPRGRRSRSSPTTASPGAPAAATPTNVPKLQVVRGRPVVGPPVKTLSPSDAIIEWSAMKPGSTIEVNTLKQVFGRRVPRLSELMRAWTDHETGSVTTITGLRASGGRISIDFMIRDAQGLPVTEGEGTRIISRDANGRLGVYHSFLRTYSEARGVGRRLTQNSIALYTRLGVDEVTVGPAWAGKYTWASFGFDWEPVDAENHRNGFAAHLVKRFGLSWIEADIHAARADYSRPWLLGSYRIGRKVTVEVDQASRVHGSFIHREECDAGKSYLLEGPGWHGTLTLDDVTSPSWQRCWSRVFLDEKGP